MLVDLAKLAVFNASLQEVTEAAEQVNVNAAGGFLIPPDQEEIIRGVGRIESIDQLAQSVVTARDGKPALLQDVATVQIGAALQRGDGSASGQRAVVVVINKQLLADTPMVTRAVERAMAEVKAGLPKDVRVLETFRQSSFIESTIKNVHDSLRDGIIIVSIITTTLH